MNINIPVKYKDLQLNDNEAMVCAFLLMLSDRWGYDTHYNMNAYDFKKMFSRNSYSMEGDSGALDKIRTHMQVAPLDEHNWALKFRIKKGKLKEWTRMWGNKEPRTVLHKLTNTRSMILWGYLMGRWNSDADIIANGRTEILPYLSSDISLTRMDKANMKIDMVK